MLPKLKKRITSFLVGEEGKISKQSLLSVGAFLGTGVLGGILVAKDASGQVSHTNSLTLDYASETATAEHGHHGSHSSHSSHGSHGSHGSHSSYHSSGTGTGTGTATATGTGTSCSCDAGSCAGY